jgi:hypothetical protein
MRRFKTKCALCNIKPNYYIFSDFPDQPSKQSRLNKMSILQKIKYLYAIKIVIFKISIHTYHSCFIPVMVAEASQIFLRDTHNFPKCVSYEKYYRLDKG